MLVLGCTFESHPISNILHWTSSPRPALCRTTLRFNFSQLFAIRLAELAFAIRRYFVLIGVIMLALKPTAVDPMARVRRRFDRLHRFSRDVHGRTCGSKCCRGPSRF